MTTFVDLNEFKKQICKALGLETDETARIVIDILPEDLIRVYVEKILTDEQIEKLPEFKAEFFDIQYAKAK